MAGARARTSRFQLRVVSPCPDPAASGPATPLGFHCGACQRDVIDFTEVTEARAAALAGLFGGHGLCGKVRVDEDGDTVFAPRARAVSSHGSAAPGPQERTSRRDAALGPQGTKSRGVRALAGAAAAALSTMACSAPPPPDHPASRLPETSRGECVPQLALEAPSPAPLAPPTPADRDGDGVSDADDVCPDQAAGERPDPNKAGCPAYVVVVQMGGVATPPAAVDGFSSGSSKLTHDHELVLNEIANVLAAHPEVKRVVVEGHASSDERAPDRVSLSRAQNVVGYLLLRGVSAARLEVKGGGKGSPIVPDSDPKAAPSNRRVTFTIAERGP